MTLHFHGRAWVLVVALVASSALVVAEEPEARSKQHPERAAAAKSDFPAEDLEFFEAKVRPILVQRCYQCHSDKTEEPKGKLRLDSRAAILQGGETSPAAVAGKPGESLLVDAINYRGLYEMPPKTRLPAEEVAILTRWVERGLPWPKEEAKVESGKGFDLAKRKADHWAWHRIPAAEPGVKRADWPQTSLDRFILARLESEGLAPAAPAGKEVLLRRLSYDLIGLPPTPAELDEFLNDASPQALENQVDRLLRSPHFGERWGRHWLDVVRYGESRGHEFDPTIPNAWQYRDYVIRAFNADLPYDQFVVEQVAGDLVEKPRLHPTEGYNESLLGTGFWFLGEWVHSPVDIRQDECDRFDNMVDTFSKAFLGLTVSCARCHDHKFDAISQKDYYALSGYLQSSSYRLARFDTIEQDRNLAEGLASVRREAAAKVAPLLAEVRKESVANFAEYLLAANQDNQPAAAGLDAKRLEKLGAELREAKIHPEHPLHLLTQSPEARRPATGQVDAVPLPGLVVDYRQGRPADWLCDGFSFGLGPSRPGDIQLSLAAVRVERTGAARRDPFWNGLKLAPGAENDWGAMTSLIRAGRTLKTPTFTVAQGPVWAYVTGEGHLTAVVASHQMINGPLHGGLSQRFRTTPGEWRWVRHDLGRYIGQRVHLEFTVEGSADLAIQSVVQGQEQPRMAPPSNPLAAVLGATPVETTRALAKAMEQTLAAALERLAQGKIAGDPHAEAWAALAAWVIEREDLFPADLAAAERLSAEQKAYGEKVSSLAKEIQPQSRLAMAMWDGSAEDEFLLIRGNSKTPAEKVSRRLPEALFGATQPAPPRGSGRLEMARRLVDPAANPLTAKVLVNRVWHHLFGRGLVASTDNFGVLGERPTHPELLQHLADAFVADGWSIKHLIKRIVLSRTYQMASTGDRAADEADPRNQLLHRAHVRRLEAEPIRDTILALSGRLDRTPFGPPVPVHLTEFMQGRGRPASGPLDGNGRRSLYVSVRRNFLSPMMLAFDAPIPFQTQGKRNISNVPAQALILMNDPFVVREAAGWAKRVLAIQSTAEERITLLYREAFARRPTEEELAAATGFLTAQGEEHGLAPDKAVSDSRVWSDLCHVLINAKEFIFLQ